MKTFPGAAPFSLVVPILLLAAAPISEADRLLRQGYAAFAQDDLERAAALFERAAERSTEPALVAFDLAGVKYRLAMRDDNPRLLEEAAQLYRCCLDPADPRRPAALYGLANCLLLRADGQDVAALREAVELYDKSLAEKDLSADLADGARLNRERARLRIIQAQAAAGESEKNPPRGAEGSAPPEKNRRPENRDPDLADSSRGKAQTGTEPRPVEGKDDANARETDEPRPGGRGNLPPIPDSGAASPLSARDAAAHVEKAAARIRDERRKTLRGRAARPPTAGVRDW